MAVIWGEEAGKFLEDRYSQVQKMLRKGERLVEGDSGKEAIDLAPSFL
jgi:hypothetical protein